MANNRDAFLAGIAGFVIAGIFQLTLASNANDARKAITEKYNNAFSMKAVPLSD